MRESGKSEVEIRLSCQVRFFVDMVSHFILTRCLPILVMLCLQIRFMYCGEFSTKDSELLEVWRVADRFEVKSVMKAIPIVLHEFPQEIGPLHLTVPFLGTFFSILSDVDDASALFLFDRLHEVAALQDVIDRGRSCLLHFLRSFELF